MSPYVGVYSLAPGTELDVSVRDGALFVTSSEGGSALRLWPESSTRFFLHEVDAQVTFTRDENGPVTGLVLHQYGRDRRAAKIR